jgi:tRNA pseudouridine55 synthase
MGGFIVPVYKPRGITSTHVVRLLKRAGGFDRIGHGGTLDPLAEGVLPILVGPATRMTEHLHAGTKTYIAAVLFGATSTTCDLGGEVLDSGRNIPAPWRVRDALQRFRGQITQIPPRYSAVRVDGRRAYSRARAGESVQVPARSVVIHRMRAIEFAFWNSRDLASTGRLGSLGGAGRLVAALEVVCGSGTYIRSLARDLGRAVGSGALLAGLLRSRVGPFAAAAAVPLAQAESLARAGRLAEVGHAPDKVAGHIPALLLGNDLARGFAHGAFARVDAKVGPCRVYATDGRFLGLGEMMEDRILRPRRVLTAAPVGGQ